MRQLLVDFATAGFEIEIGRYPKATMEKIAK